MLRIYEGFSSFVTAWSQDFLLQVSGFRIYIVLASILLD
jgi:hypothetical protein